MRVLMCMAASLRLGCFVDGGANLTCDEIQQGERVRLVIAGFPGNALDVKEAVEPFRRRLRGITSLRLRGSGGLDADRALRVVIRAVPRSEERRVGKVCS